MTLPWTGHLSLQMPPLVQVFMWEEALLISLWNFWIQLASYIWILVTVLISHYFISFSPSYYHCFALRSQDVKENSFFHGSQTHLTAEDKQILEKYQLSSTMPGLRQLCASPGKLLSLKGTRTFSAMWAGHRDNCSSPGEYNVKLELFQYGPEH